MPKRTTLTILLLSLSAACSSSSTETTKSDAQVDGAVGDTLDTIDSSLPLGRCRIDDDCRSDGSYLFCLGPGEPIGCGSDGGPGDCTTDDDCKDKPGTVCLRVACMGNKCEPGCKATSECAEGQECSPTGHCNPAKCSATTPCPKNFSCLSSQCIRTTCASDAECSGPCVKGRCYTSFGTCRDLPV